jgi:hypothetical protein
MGLMPERIFVSTALGKIDRGEFRDYSPPVTHRPEADKFLRAAVKAGLRLQQNETAETGGGMPGAGVRTLQRIKASLQKRNSPTGKQICDTK